MDKRKMKKLLILNLPYFLVGLFATNLGEAWRLAEGADSSAKILSFFHALPIALNNPFPSFHPLDLLIGILCGAGLRLAVYLKGKNAKKYRHNVEYGSARWGTAKDIEPFIAPKFEDNVILTKTERLMMSNRPKNPANTLDELSSFFRLPILFDGENIEIKKETAPKLEQTGIYLGQTNNGLSAFIDASSFKKHAFICGVPGSGKTNTMLHLANSLWHHKKLIKDDTDNLSVTFKEESDPIPFLVLEPAKLDAKNL